MPGSVSNPLLLSIHTLKNWTTKAGSNTDRGYVEPSSSSTTDAHFAEFLPQYANLEEMKAHYQKGGLGDGTCKKFLIQVLEETLSPIRAERAKWEADLDTVYDILQAGTAKAQSVTNATLARVEKAMRIDYFADRRIVKEWEKQLKAAKL